jgi:hypothetical protein
MRHLTLGDGTSVDIAVPYVALDGGNGAGLAIAPLLTAGVTGLSIDLQQWMAMYISPETTQFFTAASFDQPTAIRVARAWHADPATNWSDPHTEQVRWLQTWAPANGVPQP